MREHIDSPVDHLFSRQRIGVGRVEHGELREEQKSALNEMLKYDNGILHAATAFGKTVVCSAMIAEIMTDERIIAAMAYINLRIGGEISCGEVADAVFLSQGRFSAQGLKSNKNQDIDLMKSH